MKTNRIREKGQRSLTLTAYMITIGCILLAFVPLVWMISSSLKDSLSIYSFPPKWIPPQPQQISVVLEYEGEGGEAAGEDAEFFELEAMKATWFTWKKFQNEPIGGFTVTGVRGGKVIYKASTPSFMFTAGRTEVVPSLLFTDAMMQNKLPMIRERGYSRFVWYGPDGPSWNGAAEAATAGSAAEALPGDSPGAKVAAFLDEEASYLQGRPVAVTQQGDWRRQFDNFLALWKLNTTGGYSFLHYMWNSFLVTGASIAFQLVVGGLAGYALSRLVTPAWSRWLTLFFVATIMIPEIAILVPLYLTMEKLQLVNTLWGIILPHSAWGIVIYLFKGFFDQLPGELLQAARIDGAQEWRVFSMIVVPMSYPIMTVVGVMTFMAVWNEFLWPLVVARSEEVWTFTVALNDFQNTKEMNIVMASLVVSTFPLLFIFATSQRLIERGVSWTGVKG